MSVHSAHTTTLLSTMKGKIFLYFFVSLLSFSWLTDLCAYEAQFVQRTKTEPILKVRDPFTQCTVHLVGVSHGSPSSSNLVKKTILKIKPSAVVLELCDERYLAICLESQIPPTGNLTMLSQYNKKVKTKVDDVGQARNASDAVQRSPWSTAVAYGNFIQKQGIIVGTFVSIGLLVSSFQKALRRSDPGDEFTTAMKVADYLNIPIKLGDAQQSETLRNVKKVLSFDTLNPTKVAQNTKSLVFSALGLPMDSLFDASGLSPETRDAISRSKWINIPMVYIQDKSLIFSLIPLISISLFTLVLGYLPMWSNVVHDGNNGVSFGSSSLMLAQMQALLGKVVLSSASASPAHVTAAKHALTLSSGLHLAGFTNALPHVLFPPLLLSYAHKVAESVQPLLEKLTAMLSADPSPALTSAVDAFADVLSFLVLVRLAKIIGSDRDRIIASKIRDACKTSPGTDVVVVVGMLHCNGVARWLLSGLDPLVDDL